MPIEISQRTRTRYIRKKQCTDIVIESVSDDPTLRNEDRVEFQQSWQDYTGSGGVAKSTIQYGGNANKLQGTDAQIEGAFFPGTTDRGNNVQINRQRQFSEYIVCSNK